ncbi:MAG: tRNA (adenosine(37)-N6)-threonylcarbamoyltransferase complex dimerization subunit type 1 TsaB [Candidatus Cloacimonetes bacterium]|nr:tRNA (adenosine(37)-N6)-threonylcarbamoyltransferase complex dimerization subunit type 1 TsaB [Candidatus Cloacimonadota bacterium]
MKLAIDSSQSSGSIALCSGERVIYSAYFDIKITHSETLMPAIDFALKFCGATQTDLKEVYVCQGPGSFTGLRIGLATAKGIAFGLGIPLFAFSSLELGAQPLTGLGKNIVCAIDAKMKELYYALYDPLLNELSKPSIISPRQFVQLGLQDFILCGSATELLCPLLKDAKLNFYPVDDRLYIPSAAGLFTLGKLLPQKHVPQDVENLEPDYLRESTAQIKR